MRKPASVQRLRIYFGWIFTFLVTMATAQQQRAPGPADVPIDFSCAGYAAGKAQPPNVPAVVRVRPGGGDDTRLLQAAIDHVGNLPVQQNGFRGAVLLEKGRFMVSGQLRMVKSGVVIRGSTGLAGTIITATGMDRRTLIEIGGEDTLAPGPAVQVTDTLVAAGSRTLTLDHPEGIRTGDRIVITRPSTAIWIADLGMNKAEGMFVDRRGLQWPAGSRDLVWDRVVTGTDPGKQQVTLDAPITTAVQRYYGGATVRKREKDGFVHHVGVEGLTLESAYDPANSYDEEHSWIAIAVNNAEDCWVRDVAALHFVHAAVRTGQRARRISISGCSSREPVSEPVGYRRYSFLVEGQQVLVRNCTADSGMNDFAIGFCAGGPNVFLDCRATRALDASGSFESWASGVLYENVTVEGAGLRLTYDFDRSQGGGWTAVNSVVWNCKATEIVVQAPDGYPNLVTASGSSLYRNQLTSRQGGGPDTALQVPDLYAIKSLAQVRAFTRKDVPAEATAVKPAIHPLEIVNGRFVMDGAVVWGGTTGDQYWRGQPFPGGELNSGISITRYVPGKTGPGLTEDLPALARSFSRQGARFYTGVTGLWYDRRRDDHSTLKRTDSHVWAPFYEMPWARSGKGKAWDGMSLYDLNAYNPWYFHRAREFARLCDENGLVFYYNLYDTHNLLEYVTHWVDYPFRPVNTINETGIPELPVEPWARLHLGNQFYDPANPNLRRLHRAYIFHVLDELGQSRNIVFNLGIQFSGPLAFQQFFIQTIGEWEKQHNTDVRIVLNASKDVTDSILADPALAAQINIIDTRYWQYRPGGLFSNSDSLWAPPGGQNRSYREMVGEAFLQETDYPLPTTQELMYRQVREYTDRFPEKAVVAVYNEVSPIASVMAGGAQVLMGNVKERGNGHLSFNGFLQQYLGRILMNMKPVDGLLDNKEQNWCLKDKDNRSVLIYSLSGPAITCSKTVAGGEYTGTWFDALTERTIPLDHTVQLQRGSTLKKPTGTNWLLLLQAVK